MSFARTKLLPPKPRAGAWIERPALQRRLAEALAGHRLVLLCAPAGCGKTAALAQQFDVPRPGCALAWIAADPGDDLALLLECLVAALEPWDPPWRTAPEALVAALGEAGPRARRAIADELINTLDACDVERGVIVVDDLHRIDDPAVHAFLDHLLERLTPRWTLALTSRVEPPLALARLRAAGELAEFQQADLRFDAGEARALAAAAGLGDALAAALVERTDGWAAGLRLAVDALRRGPAGGSPTGRVDRPLIEFLDAEIIDRLAPELRQFLLRTSVLPELNATSAAAVSGNPRAAGLLDEVLRQGLFVTWHDGGGESTLRLHDLLRDALAQRLAREHADELPELLRRAAAHERDVRRRLDLLLRAGAHDEAQHALAEATPGLLAAGDSARVQRLLEGFPPSLAEHSPMLAYVAGLAAWPRFEWAAMDVALARAAAGFEAAGAATLARRARAWRIVALAGLGRLPEAQRALDALAQAEGPAPDRDVDVHLQLMAFWLSGATGPADGPSRHLRAMLASLGRDAAPALWYRSAPHFMFIGRPGLLGPLQQYVDAALATAGDAHVPLRAAALALGAWVQMWRGRLADADALMAQARDDDRWLGGQRSLRIPVLAFEAARASLDGDVDAVRRHGLAMIDDVDQDPGRRPIWLGVYLMHVARMALGIGDVETARALHARLRSTPGEREWPVMVHARRVLDGAMRLHDGDIAGALPLLEGAVGALDEIDMLGLQAGTRLLAALARVRAGDRAAAADWLRPLFERVRRLAARGEPADTGGAWIGSREPVAALAAVDWQGHLAEDDHATLRDWRDRLWRPVPAAATAALGGAAPRLAANTAEPLSAREREVLARIAAGDSNKVIARAFDLSPHTVKRHVANILDKLALTSRGQAAAWFRERGRAA